MAHAPEHNRNETKAVSTIIPVVSSSPACDRTNGSRKNSVGPMSPMHDGTNTPLKVFIPRESRSGRPDGGGVAISGRSSASSSSWKFGRSSPSRSNDDSRLAAARRAARTPTHHDSCAASDAGKARGGHTKASHYVRSPSNLTQRGARTAKHRRHPPFCKLEKAWRCRPARFRSTVLERSREPTQNRRLQERAGNIGDDRARA